MRGDQTCGGSSAAVYFDCITHSHPETPPETALVSAMEPSAADRAASNSAGIRILGIGNSSATAAA